MGKTGKSKELSPKTQEFIEKRGIVLFVWVLLLAVGWMRNSESLLRGELKANDDYMRMVQIRDWLGGQSWFDLHQYRLNPSDPLLSHWSRISDVLIGVPIKILTPVFGQPIAELIAVTAFPALLLLGFLFMAAKLTATISKSSAVPLAAAFMTSLSFATLMQFELGRIDHHGLQILMALLCCWFIIKSQTGAIYAIFAGISCGLGLYVGIESAPYIAAACIAVGLFWVLNEVEAEKRLRYFGLSIAATTLISLAASAPPSRWLIPSCDAISIFYTQLTLGVALVLWGVSFASTKISRPISRLILLGALGSLVIVGTVWIYPNCSRGPYAEIDPRLAEVWLSKVSEAGKFHTFFINEIVGGTAVAVLPVFSMIGVILYHRKTRGALSIAPRTITIFMFLTFIAGLIQFRLMSFSSALAIPFAAYLVVFSFEWTEKINQPASRTLARLGFIIALAPITIPLILRGFIALGDMPHNTAAAEPRDDGKYACLEPASIEALNALPGGLVLSPIDLGGRLLYHTHLSVTSAPYHRNTIGNLATLDMFIEDEAAAKLSATNIGANYVLACRNSKEAEVLMREGPDGMLSKLLDGYQPDWLEKIDVDKSDNLLVYRVKTAN